MTISEFRKDFAEIKARLPKGDPEVAYIQGFFDAFLIYSVNMFEEGQTHVSPLLMNFVNRYKKG